MAEARALRWLIVWIAAAGVLALSGCSQGKTPSSGFVKDAFGSESVVFDLVTNGMGSSEKRSREVIVVTDLSPAEVLATIAASSGWRRLDGALERRSDGLCVSAMGAEDYVGQEAVFRNASVTEAARRHPGSVVLTLLFC